MLAGATVPFQWAANGTPVTSWQLDVGSSLGAADHYSSGILGAGTLADTATGLPLDSSPVFVRLSFVTGGVSQFIDVQYTAAPPPTPPTITSPPPGSVLPGATVPFQWTANGTPVTAWELIIGSSLGASDLFAGGFPGGTLSTTVNGLPTDGRTIFVRLWYQSGSFQFVDFQYTAAPGP